MFAQSTPKREFQEGNTTQLVMFESSLPAKVYDFRTSDLQVKWHVLMLDLLEQTVGYTPNVAARSLAYIDLAAYEAIVPGFANIQSLSGQLQNYKLPKEYEIDSTDFIPELALNNAMFSLVDKLFIAAPYVWMERAQSLKDSVNTLFSKDKSQFAIMKSINYGVSVADMIYKYSENDGGHNAIFRNFDLNYKLPKCESCFTINRVADLENTGPLHPNWGKNRTFFIDNETDFGIKPETPFSIYKDSKFYKQALEVYETSKTVVAGNEKLIIANFWDDAATFTYTAVGHSISILTQVLRKDTMSMIEAAKKYATLTMALNDAMICTWEAKYKFNLMRPNAYIKKYIDSKWEPAILTPPFPEFPSGHSVQSATMATVLTAIVGDSTSFTDYSKYWVGEPRTFKNFWQAANETSISRLYGGIHFTESLKKGQEMGKIVGTNALKIKFEK